MSKKEKAVAVVIAEEGDGVNMSVAVIVNGDLIEAADCSDEQINDHALLLQLAEHMVIHTVNMVKDKEEEL